jgi:XTP/dITP diphosphohydrolase
MNEPLRVLLATGNRDKVREIKRMLVLPSVELLDLSAFPQLSRPDEDGSTLCENALKKARWASARTGLPALSDDTGLEVDALDGRPGLYSARLAGPEATYEDNRRRLLEMLQGVGGDLRGATFRCVVAITDPSGWEDTVEGSCRGVITSEPRGGGCFGYDPLFLVPASGKTFAEMTDQEKDSVSHRGQAIRRARGIILARYGL